MRVLVVEDEEPKRVKVIEALRRIEPNVSSIEAHSVSSAIKFIREERVDLVLLDMSLPTFDVRPGETGGRPQGFGGVEVLRYIDRFDLSVPVIVVTAYETFSKDRVQLDLDSLDNQLRTNHPATFKGVVFYNPVYSKWHEELGLMIRKVIGR